MKYQKEIEVEINIDGVPLQGTSTILVEDGKINYSLAEEHFYEILRKWGKNWIKEWEEEYKEKIIKQLTSEQKDILRNQHAKNYHGTDDEMEDYFEEWLLDISLDELKEWLKI